MRALIKLFSVSFLICSVLYVFSNIADAATQINSKSLTFLFIGLDDSPANTDVLSVVSYDGEANTVRTIQIPRDTCIRHQSENIKINGYYSSNVNIGKTEDEALDSLVQTVSELLGIEIDGYLALTTEGFVDTVDYLGGILLSPSDIPEPLREGDELSREKIRLDGKSALELVRYRESYKRGDLERLDAQKKIAKAIFSDLKDSREIFTLLKFVSNHNGIRFALNKGKSISFLVQNIFKISDADFQIATLPGKAIKSEGISYYVIDKEKAKALVRGYFPHSSQDFDTNNNFVYRM